MEEVIVEAPQWFAVFNRETGALFSIGTDLAEVLPEELDYITCDSRPDVALWDTKKRNFIIPRGK